VRRGCEGAIPVQVDAEMESLAVEDLLQFARLVAQGFVVTA